MTKHQTIVLYVVVMIFASSCAQRASTEPTAKTLMVNAVKPIRVSAENTDAAEPAVGVGRDGTAYVAWVEHRAKGVADVFLAHFNREGQQQGVPVRVNPNIGEAKAWHGDPPTVAVAQDGTVYVGWTARAGETGHQTDIYLSVSRDEGKSFGTPVKVNDDEKPGMHGMHSLALPADNRVYLAWLDERNLAPPPKQPKGVPHKHIERNREVFIASSTDGGRTFSPNQRIASEACPCCKTSLATGPNGRVYASWRQVLSGDFRHIAVSSSTDGGKIFSSPVIVSDDRWQINGCPVSGAALAIGTDETLRVLWYTAGEAGKPGLYWSESRDGGQTFAPRKPFADGSGHGTPSFLGYKDNVLVAVWENSDDNAALVTTAQLLSDGHVTPNSPVTSGGELPSGAATSDQLFVAYISQKDNQHSIWLVRAKPVVQS
ncbi:MAG: glycoside hydrolase [Acidobacteriota bacterium]|nr:glycoside hydrolase [Acidobacteriota bacterium]